MNEIIHAEEKAKLGKAIADLRFEKDMSQKSLAKKAMIAVSTLLEIEKGRANITLDIILDIADALDVSLLYLIIRTCEKDKLLQVKSSECEKLVHDLVIALFRNIK